MTSVTATMAVMRRLRMLVQTGSSTARSNSGIRQVEDKTSLYSHRGSMMASATASLTALMNLSDDKNLTQKRYFLTQSTVKFKFLTF